MTDLSYKNKKFINALLIKEPSISISSIYKYVKSFNTKEISNKSVKEFVTKKRIVQKGGLSDEEYNKINENPTLYLYDLFKKYNDKNDTELMSINNLVQYISKNKKINPREQQDVQDFFQQLSNISNTNNGVKFDEIINNLFQYTENSKIWCGTEQDFKKKECIKDFTNEDNETNPLTTYSQRNLAATIFFIENELVIKGLTYQDAIDGFSNIEKLSEEEGYNSCKNGELCNGSIKENLNTYKQLTIQNPKNYFIIVPKLYQTSGNINTFQSKKISDSDIKIKYSNEITICEEIFELIGIVIHIGSSKGGHYTAYVKKKDKWWFLNDSSKPIKQNPNADNVKPYMAFYKKKNYNLPQEELNKLNMLDAPREIINPGIFCYANALMQILFNNETLYYDLTQGFIKNTKKLNKNANTINTNTTTGKKPKEVVKQVEQNSPNSQENLSDQFNNTEPETSQVFSNDTINTFIEGFNKLDKSVEQITLKLNNLKDALNNLKKPSAGGAIQTGGAITENDIPIYKNILETVNKEALLKEFTAETYQLILNLWDPNKDNDLKQFLKDNQDDDICNYFIENNGQYYFSDIKFTQIMVGQLNEDALYPNKITEENFTKFYKK